jgi:hypothetical protein
VFVLGASLLNHNYLAALHQPARALSFRINTFPRSLVMFENLTAARVVAGAVLLVGCLLLAQAYNLTSTAPGQMDR